MSYLLNNSLGAADANSFSCSFWFKGSNATEEVTLLDSLVLGTDYYGDTDTTTFRFKFSQSAAPFPLNNLRFETKRAVQYFPGTGVPTDVDDVLYILEAGRLAYLNLPTDSPPGTNNPPGSSFRRLSLPPLVGDTDPRTPGLATSTVVSGMTVTTTYGPPVSTSYGVDFTSASAGVIQDWPPPTDPYGTEITFPATSIVSANVSGGQTFVRVRYHGDLSPVEQIVYSRAYNTTTNAFLPSAWNHCAYAINNSTRTHLWVINGANRTGTTEDHGGNSETSAAVPFSCQFNGAKTWFHKNHDYPDDDIIHATGLVRLDNFQFWTGQYIDWTDSVNFSKVVTITGSTGTPAPVSAASNFFGQPQIWFNGNSASFKTNRGTAGAFAKIGTIRDYRPTPSYG